MKKILFYCDTVFGVGGVQRVLAEVAKRLSDGNGWIAFSWAV